MFFRFRQIFDPKIERVRRGMTKWQTETCVLAAESAKIGLAHRLMDRGMQTETTYPKITKNGKIMNVKPLSDRVLILPNPAEEKTAGGLIIPDTAKEKPLAGKVVAVGPGSKDVKMEVKEGDRVLYGKYAGQELRIDGVDYLIMKQNDILAII